MVKRIIVIQKLDKKRNQENKGVEEEIEKIITETKSISIRCNKGEKGEKMAKIEGYLSI